MADLPQLADLCNGWRYCRRKITHVVARRVCTWFCAERMVELSCRSLLRSEWERTLLWNDPSLGIEWPLVEGNPLLLSAKDQQGTPLALAELFD
jgi:hypothetical protein